MALTWLQKLVGCKECPDSDAEKVLLEQEISTLKQENYADKQALSYAEAKVAKLEKDFDSVDGALKECIKLHPGESVPEEAELYWNGKYPKTKVKYACRHLYLSPKDGTGHMVLSTDVMDFWDYNNQDVQAIAVTIKVTNQKAWKANDWDELAWLAEKHVKQYIKYRSDKIVQGVDEYWQFVYETLVLKSGDCEDGAILLANVMVALGIPYWRIRLNVGAVKGGRHAYVTYCRTTDNEFVPADWCYWTTMSKMKDRKLHRDQRDYYGIEFSWNTKSAYASPDYKGDKIAQVVNG